ncbi:hypothetical protein H310_08181 [Aphanomyces invadans]|uniref:CDP-diacylglycerol--glycerol-3-phosphate 3-phosphatidyltransferase n=1 Tax=Aphanomyces invadans TaxID=157072 RepID=A0A024U1N6_9STRA|nr:hypothetical protein H310_08181 [Aphanomyces invadans]ETV99507.1 hypothetical protein H310_08181 [Aphanomyces invadans]|eukprot:XP_008872063.1 hypothetical protein H310_08181 [Aphanomyces invadans]
MGPAAPDASAIGDVIDDLRESTPSFPLNGSDVTILHSPTDFYNQLLQNIHRAKKRISISSLYIGNDALSRRLVQALQDACQDNPSLQVSIVLDYSRGQRGGPTSSVAVLTPLLATFPSKVSLHLYRVPQLDRWGFLPPPFDETIGVSHTKVYLCDDTLIMSGANLSGDYFTQRQDRYLQLYNANLAEFYHTFVQILTNHAHHVQLVPCTTGATSSKASVGAMATNKIVPPKTTHADFASALLSLQDYQPTTPRWTTDAMAIPTIQFSPLEILHDEDTLSHVLHRLPSASRIGIASGYLNFPPFLMRLLAERAFHLDVVTAAPSANGFFNGNGIKGALPMAYSLIEGEFYHRFADSPLTLREYNRDAWTFHAKGMWIQHDDEALTVVGSSNFGQRSYGRDLESQVFLYSTNSTLRSQLKDEYTRLTKHSEAVTESLWKRPERKLQGLLNWKSGHWIRPAMRAVKSFL